MSQGKQYLLFVSATGVTTTGLLEVPLQGDATINFGKSIQVTKYKNGQSSAQSDQGVTINIEIGNAAPMAAGETRMWALHDSGDLAFFELQSSVNGAVEFSFQGRVAMSSMSAPVSGPTSVSMQIGVEGNMTRAVAT